MFKVWSEDKLNKKFVVAENFAELVSKGKRFWWDHLQQNALNRERGVEKAKATGQRKKQEKKK